MIDKLSNTTEGSNSLAYFYCDFRTYRWTHAFEVIRSLLTRFLRRAKKDWLASFKDLEDRRSDGSPPPEDLETLYKLLLRALDLHDRPIVVIDALDECKDHIKLSKLLARLHGQGCCRLFITSRPIADISSALDTLPKINLDEMHVEMQSDMRIHITQEVTDRPKLMPFRDEIIGSLLEKADNM